MTSPLVTVVIPTYNYGRYICQTVESALGQTYSPVEIIVVDDGSTDDTRERLTAYGDRVRYIYLQNRGVSTARNIGIQAARGEFVALLDSDDLWLPDKLERQVTVGIHQPDIGLVATERFAIDEPDDGWITWPNPLPGTGFVSLPRAICWSLLRSAPLPFSPAGITYWRSADSTRALTPSRTWRCGCASPRAFGWCA